MSSRQQKRRLQRLFCYRDPKGIQFELLLAHFEQLRLVYEMQDDEEDNNV